MTDLSKLPSYVAPRRSIFSARKFALMASVVAGLGAVSDPTVELDPLLHDPFWKGLAYQLTAAGKVLAVPPPDGAGLGGFGGRGGLGGFGGLGQHASEQSPSWQQQVPFGQSWSCLHSAG